MQTISCLIMMYMVFSHPEITADAARRALHIFASDLVPTLFPYMVLTRMLFSKARNPSIWTVVIFSLLGGSPSGASILNAYASRYPMKRRYLMALCTLTGTISPAFLFNTVSTWLNSTKMGILLGTSHYIGAIATSILVYLLPINDESEISCIQYSNSEYETNAISASIIPILGVGGCLTFFSVLSAAINTLLFHTSGMHTALTHAILEISGGVKELCKYITLKASASPLAIAFSIGFTGLSILSQNAMFLMKQRISVAELAGLGILRGMVTTGITWVLINL